MNNSWAIVFTRNKWFIVVLLAIVSVASVLYINGSIFYLVSTKRISSDMREHIIDARLIVEKRVTVIYKVSIGSNVNIKHSRFVDDRYLETPYKYAVFHYSLVGIRNALHTSYEIAWWYTVMIAQIIVLFITVYVIRIHITATPMALPISMILASLLFIVSSLYIPWYSPSMYVGFLNGNIYHNATTIVAKPILYATILAMAIWLKDNDHHVNWKLIICTNVLVILGALAKPNVPMAIIPAWSVVVALKFFTDTKKSYLQYATYLLPIIVTVCTMLALTTGRLNDTYTVGVSWWYVAKHFTSNPLISMILTVAFPIGVTLLYPHILHNKMFQLAIISFIVSVLTYWIFYEIAFNTPSTVPNFGWGARMTGGFFFALTSAELVNAYNRRRSRLDYVKFRIALLLLFGHVISGVIYTIRLYELEQYKL